MIDKKEIEAKAKEFEIHVANVERDYVFGWFLFGIFSVSNLKDTIFLKGGNALRKGYFENTRFSTDLDFGIPGDISEDVLLNEMNKVCDFIQERTKVVFIKENNKVTEKFVAAESPLPDLRVWEVRVYFRDFYAGTDHFTIKISMDITRFDKVLLPIQSCRLIHPYSDANELVCMLRCMKLEEIIATKLKCLLQRQHAPDLFDYVHTIRILGGEINKEEVVRTFIRKTIFGRNPSVVKDILHHTSFDYFRKYWHKTIVCAKQLIFEAEEAIALFRSDLESLFGMFPNNGYVQFAYFGPELRVPIMAAGRAQTLLKINYKGCERMVEPYALKYLQRRDGVEREYLYVFNVSGGGSVPGMRTFVAERIGAIENTEEKFEPRHIIELCKAGEKPENPYLFDPNRPLPSPKRRAGRSTGLMYVYQCSYCGKRFSRKTQNSMLRPHKSKSGYPCGGRTGFYVTTKY